ncbi:MAG: hypothetical protein FI695_05305 [SAR202 cluster bacterium]|nr:hypothetical protein [SAR202 cluster bacterium]
MLLRNSRSIIGISLIIALATFGLFYSTAYAGDADGAITDDTTFAFKQNHFEHSTQALTVAGAVGQTQAYASLGADGATQAFTSDNLNNANVQAVTLPAVADGAATTITTSVKMLKAHEAGFPKIVADGGNCDSGAVANSTGTVASAAHRINGTVTITMGGGALTAGDYELCYRTVGGILDGGSQDVTISNAAHRSLNGAYKLVANGGNSGSGAIANSTVTRVDAQTLRISMSGGALAVNTDFELVYDWGGLVDGGTVDVDISNAAHTPLLAVAAGTYSGMKLVADGGTVSTAAVANSAVTKVDANTVRITMSGGRLENATDYELVYAYGGYSDAATTDIDISNADHVPMLTANGLHRVVADAGTCASNAVANTTTSVVDTNTLRVTMGAGQVLVPGNYELCYGWGKDPNKHFGWNWTNAGRTVKVTVGLNSGWANEVSAIEVFVNPAVAETGETAAASKKPNATFRMGNNGFFPTGNQLDLLFTCDEKCSPGAISASTKVGIHVVKTTSGTSVDTFKSNNPTNTTELNAMANVGFKLDQTTSSATTATAAPAAIPTATPVPELPKAGGTTPSNNLLIVTGLAGTLLIIMSSFFIFRRRAEARIK